MFNFISIIKNQKKNQKKIMFNVVCMIGYVGAIGVGR